MHTAAQKLTAILNTKALAARQPAPAPWLPRGQVCTMQAAEQLAVAPQLAASCKERVQPLLTAAQSSGLAALHSSSNSRIATQRDSIDTHRRHAIVALAARSTTPHHARRKHLRLHQAHAAASRPPPLLPVWLPRCCPSPLIDLRLFSRKSLHLHHLATLWSTAWAQLTTIFDL